MDHSGILEHGCTSFIVLVASPTYGSSSRVTVDKKSDLYYDPTSLANKDLTRLTRVVSNWTVQGRCPAHLKSHILTTSPRLSAATWTDGRTDANSQHVAVSFRDDEWLPGGVTV